LSVSELLAFIALMTYMGIDYKPQLFMYWHEFFGSPFVVSIMSRSRFKDILSCFCITKPVSDDVINDPAHHVQSTIDTLNNRLRKHFHAQQNLVFDESMIAFKGKAKIKQYLPMKPHKWGFKMWSLCSGGYLLRFGLYEGKSDNESEHGSTYDLVISFMEGFSGKNHILFIDSYFTSPALLSALAQMNIATCGSVRINRKGLPPKSQLPSKQLDKMKRGEILHFQTTTMCLAILKDQNIIKVLYNHISPTSPDVTLPRWGDDGQKYDLTCPRAISDYYYGARQVDVVDQLHYSYLLGRKSKRTFSRIAWWLIDMCIINAFRLYQLDQPLVKQLDFRISLMRELVAEWLKGKAAESNTPEPDRELPLACVHFSESKQKERDCNYCSDRGEKRVQTCYFCAACQKHLCLGTCFAKFHAKK
jgi:hypothetical protein